MNTWTPFWTVWGVALGIVLLTFLVAEGIALARPAIGDTLSETMWYLRDKSSPMFWIILDTIVIAAIALAWTLFHFQYQSGRVQ